MKKIKSVLFVMTLFFAGCAGTQEKKLTEDYWNFSRPVLFAPENMFSEDYSVKAKALLDYTSLEDDSKKKVITYLAYMLADEAKASLRHAILDLLRDINAGAFVVPPLVNAYGKSRSGEIRAEISQFIDEYDPLTLDLSALIKLLKEKDWETRIKAIKVIASMKSKAASALPEIISVMRLTGPSYGLYAECYDSAKKINSGVVTAAAALDLAGPAQEIRESALRKLYEVYTNEESASKDRETAIDAVVRLMYKEDGELSDLAKKMLEKAGTAKAKAKTAEFSAYKNMKVESMKSLAAAKIKAKSAEEEENLYLTLKLYFIKNGRSDAAGLITDPAKASVKP